MIKKLKQVLQANPSVPYIKAGKEKEFAGIHKVLKTNDANGNDDEVFKGSKVKVAPREGKGKSPESSPKDSYGEGRISLKVSPDNTEDEYGGHDEETEINELSKKTLKSYKKKAGEYIDKGASQPKHFKRVSGYKDATERQRGYWPQRSIYAPNKRYYDEETELDERAYDKHAVNKEIRKDKRIGGKEAKLIHRLLRGRTTDKKQDHSMGSIIRKEDTIDEVSIDKATNYINKSIGKLSSGQNVKNKVAGISRASGKVALAQGILTPSALKTKVKASEETEIDEKDHGATHQLRIARKTLLMPDAMAGVMGGMNKKEAAEIIKRSRQRLKKNEPTVMTHEELDEGHIHLTVTHESSSKPVFTAKASSDSEVRTKLTSLKAHGEAGYRVGVHNTKTGETWSGKPHHKFPGFGEEAINELSAKVLHNYAQKARQDAARLQKGQSAAIKTGTDPDNVFTHQGFHKAANRGKGFDLAYKKFYAKAMTKEDLFIEQIPSIPPDQPVNTTPLKKASSIEGLARRGVKLRVAQKKHELLKKRII